MPNIIDIHTIEVINFVDAQLQTSGMQGSLDAGSSTIQTDENTRVTFVFLYKNGYPSATGPFTIAWFNDAARTQPYTNDLPSNPIFTPSTPLDADADPAVPSGIADYTDADVWRLAQLAVTAPEVPTRLASDTRIDWDIYGQITMPQADFNRQTGDDGVR